MAPRTFGLVPETLSLPDYKAAFDAHLDDVAHQRQYDNRMTIATYTVSTNKVWANEAQAYVAWRDAALVSMFEQLAAAEAGADAPTVAEFIEALPEIVWPANP